MAYANLQKIDDTESSEISVCAGIICMSSSVNFACWASQEQGGSCGTQSVTKAKHTAMPDAIQNYTRAKTKMRKNDDVP